MSLNACKDTDSKKSSKRKKVKSECETNPPDDLVKESTFELVSEWKGPQKKKKKKLISEWKGPLKKKKKTFSCVVCVQQFNKKSLLKKHHLGGWNPHQEDGIYKCFVCDEVFKTKDKVKDHQKGHSEKPYFCCDACGEDYYDNEEYLEHRIKHLTTFKCDVCENMKLKYETNFCLKYHMAVHANRRCYICMCGQRFMKPHQYNNHKRTCMKCGICGKMFLNQDMLRTHKRIAHGVKDSSTNKSGKHGEKQKEEHLYCYFCGKNFQDYRALEYHVHEGHLKQDANSQDAYRKFKKDFLIQKEATRKAQKLSIMKSEQESEKDISENEREPPKKRSIIKSEQESEKDISENEKEPPQKLSIIRSEEESEKDISENEKEPSQKLRIIKSDEETGKDANENEKEPPQKLKKIGETNEDMQKCHPTDRQ